MSKKSFLLGAIASVIAINSVFADATITTKNYVDTTRQATIPASGTNANTPGETVVTYTDTAGTIGERGIFNLETGWDDENEEIASGHEGDLVTADFIVPAVDGLYQAQTGPANTVAMYTLTGRLGGSRGVCDATAEENGNCENNYLVTRDMLSDQIEQVTDLPETTVTYKTCTEWVANAAQTDENCLLWALDDKNVYGGCTTKQDCDGRCKMCVDGACVDNPNCQV